MTERALAGIQPRPGGNVRAAVLVILQDPLSERPRAGEREKHESEQAHGPCFT
jgi:hypothetical protein